MSDSALNTWIDLMSKKASPSILSCGEKVWENSVNHDRKIFAPHGKWETTDIKAGVGVDIVADLHTINVDCSIRYDGIFCPSVLEHVRKPWVCVNSMALMLMPGGALMINTHQTFPLHYYPDDYFRFSTNALETMCEDAGLKVLASCYTSRCDILPREKPIVWNKDAPAWLEVSICAVNND